MKEKIKIIIDWVKSNRILVLILLIGAFLRLYNIEGYMTFLGDEGRDAIVVRNLLVHADPILIGPGTSIGEMYLGPLYYYFMAPFLLLANFSPVGPAVGVALLGVFTIALVYWVCKEWFSTKNEKVSVAGIVASLLYAISPTVINFSHSSWNPNIMPFFSLLTIYSIWRVWKRDDNRYLFVAAISFAFVLQSHYLGLLIAPVIGIIWFYKFLLLNTKTSYITEKTPLIKFIKNSIFALVLFLFLMSPLLIFDIRHNWMNFNAMKTFFTERQTNFSNTSLSLFTKIPPMASGIISSLVASKNRVIGEMVLTIVSISSLLIFLGRKKLHSDEASGFSMLFLWIIFGLIGLGIYKQNVYDHYFGFLFTAPHILIGGFVENVLEKLNNIGKFFIIIALSFLFIINIIKNPLRNNPNYQLQRSVNVVNKIIKESKGETFNFAVIAERNYEDGYQYFLEKEKSKFVEIDSQIEESVTNQLFVVCEVEESKCDPTHSAKAEIANFGWSKIDERYVVDGVVIYKLIHTK